MAPGWRDKRTMEPSAPLPIVPDYKDRRGGLIAFGIVVILTGCVCALFVPMMFLGQIVSAHKTTRGPDFRSLVPAVVMYAGLAVAFVWLGIGSIQARRWARALLLILAWCWLVTGLITLAAMAVFIPKVFAQAQLSSPTAMPANALMVAMIVIVVLLSLFFILLPGGLVLFYRSRNVKATCEVSDPVPRWTDACPLPVLAMSLMLALGAVMILFMPVCYNGVVPFFGRLLSGWMGSTLCVLMVALWSYCAWAMYRLNPLGWALTVAGLGLMAGSASITFAQVDLIEMYRLMNYSEEQIRLIQHTGITNSPAMRILMIAGWVPMFGFLLYVKKFFQRVS